MVGINLEKTSNHHRPLNGFNFENRESRLERVEQIMPEIGECLMPYYLLFAGTAIGGLVSYFSENPKGLIDGVSVGALSGLISCAVTIIKDRKNIK